MLAQEGVQPIGEKLSIGAMPSNDIRIQQALTARLVELFPADRVGAFVGGAHTEMLRDNVVSTVTDAQLEVLRAQLAAGDGGELRPRAGSGKTTAHAPYSSAALVEGLAESRVSWVDGGGKEREWTLRAVGVWPEGTLQFDWPRGLWAA